MGRFINPFSDWGFKHIFGRDISKPLLIDFLNCLLEGEKVVKDITIDRNEVQPEMVDERTVIFDVYCTSDTGEKFIVEMQSGTQPNFIDRTLYYASRVITQQGEKGAAWQYGINAVYGVFFMNFKYASLESKFRIDAQLIDNQSHVLVSDKLRLIYLQLPLFDKTEEDECESDFDKWIYVLKNMEVLERMPFAAKNAVFERLASISDVSKLDKKERVQYDISLKRYRDALSTIAGAEMEGENRGIKKGIELGRDEKGREIAAKMKSRGESVEIIKDYTGLSEEEIAQL